MWKKDFVASLFIPFIQYANLSDIKYEITRLNINHEPKIRTDFCSEVNLTEMLHNRVTDLQKVLLMNFVII